MKLLSFAATSSKQSINKQLVNYASKLLDDVEVEHIDLNDFEMPIYSIDRQNEGGVPQLAHDFFDAIGRADALLIAFAEHNGFYTAAYKNLFDWTSRIDMRVFQDKPTVMLATSAGPGGANNVLQTAVASAPFFGNDVMASLSIPSFHENFDVATGAMTNPELNVQLQATVRSLIPNSEMSLT